MKIAAFNAVCPYEIGDKTKSRRRIAPDMAARFHVAPAAIVEEVHTITDIVCVHRLKAGTVEFLYELDGGGDLVRLSAPEKGAVSCRR